MNSTGQPDSGSGQHPPPGPSDASLDATLTGRSTAELSPGTLLANRFIIIRQLGMGGMGVVYSATDTALDVPVAIKLLRLEMADRPGAFERFRQELLLSRQVSSPHVVRIHDIAQHEGRWLISMDLLEGEPLDRLIDTRGPLSLDQALSIARQIALGLSAAHARRVIHRDLKPSNILVAESGAVTIVDFGIARSLGTRGVTQTGTVVGTPDYLSPEQARAEPVDSRSDLYALGLLFYEMLAGQPPFSGGTSAESLTQRLTGPPPGIRKLRADVPPWVESLIARLLATRAAHRLQSADEVVQAIDRKRVPWALPRARTLALAAAVLALVGLSALLPGRHASTPEPLPVGPAPDRLVVLPIDNGDGDPALDPALAGFTDLLRQGLAVGSGLVVVDGERTDQAVAQLGMPGNQSAEVDPKVLMREARATLAVRPRMQRDAQGIRFSATLWRSRARPEELASESRPDLLSAAAAFAGAINAKLRPDQPSGSLTTVLPSRLDAMSAYGDGIRERRRGRLETALDRFAAASALDPDFGAAWLAQAQVGFLAGKSEASERAADRGLVLSTPGRMHSELGQWKALATGDTATTIAAQQSRAKSSPDDLDALLRLAFLQGQAGQLAPATENLHRLLGRDPNDPRAWFLLGKFSIMRGNFRVAVDEHLVRALVLFKRGRNPFGEAETVNALGVGYARLGQTDDASEQFRKAVDLRRALGDRRGVASSLRNLAQQAIVQGRFADAQAQLDEARSLFLGLSDQEGTSAVENELGLLAEERGDFVAAQAAFRRMLRSREQAGDVLGVAESLNNIGFAQFQLGDYDSANVYWQQALAAFQKLDDPNGLAQAQQNLGSLEIARGRWKQARQLLEFSLASAEKHQMVEETAVSKFYLGELCLLEGRLADALDFARSAQSLFSERKDQRGIIDAGWLEARILFAANAISRATKRDQQLSAMLKGASDEQKTVAALLHAQMAQRRADVAVERSSVAQARSFAEASGIQMLKLRTAIFATPGNPALREQAARLGNLPVRLEELEQSLRFQLSSGQLTAAADTYRESQLALDKHGQAFAGLALHALGAQVFQRTGDKPGRAAALSRARAAAEQVRAGLSADMRSEFESLPEIQAVLGAERGK